MAKIITNNKRINIPELLIRGVMYAILLAIAAVTLFPVVYSLLGGFKTTQELMTSSSLIPKSFSFENYVYVWDRVNFGRYTFNSLVVTVAVVLVQMLMSTMTAYAFSRRDFRFKKIIRMMYISVLFIHAGTATLYPKYQLIVDMGINKNFLGLIFAESAAPITAILLVEGYLAGISKSFDEAAKIDGCSFVKTFTHIIFPMMLPVICVNALLAFRSVWNAYLMPMIITAGNDKLQLLSVAIVELKSGGAGMATNWAAILAAVNISIVPVVLVYIICNKQFISGVSAGGVKG
ncbi:MAG: carbohydrate ABC transporter permease [Clostridia bacterium]|nr:carbohydrate ABC transporter permease [Clostridia bacterium]